MYWNFCGDFISRNREKAGSANFCGFNFGDYAACLILRPIDDTFSRFYFLWMQTTCSSWNTRKLIHCEISTYMYTVFLTEHDFVGADRSLWIGEHNVIYRSWVLDWVVKSDGKSATLGYIVMDYVTYSIGSKPACMVNHDETCSINGCLILGIFYVQILQQQWQCQAHYASSIHVYN